MYVYDPCKNVGKIPVNRLHVLDKKKIIILKILRHIWIDQIRALLLRVCNRVGGSNSLQIPFFATFHAAGQSIHLPRHEYRLAAF